MLHFRGFMQAPSCGRGRRTKGSAAFLLGVLLLGVSCFIHFLRIELEEVGDDFGFGRVGRVHFIQHDIAEL